MAQYDAILNVGGQFDERGFESKLQQSLSRVEKNVKFSAFSGASRNVRDFNSELDRANQRVITLGASFAVLSTSIRVFKDIISSTVAVEKALTDINSVFQLSTKSMDTFAKGLFNVARETSQSFEKTAEAAKEFSRQGLGATEVLKRTRDAMVLTRLASLDAEEAVSTLTASINGFQRAALDSTQIVNKLATVDAAFAVSSKDLAQGLARAGAAASDAGVSFDQLIGLITSAQQTTARGGSVIGNSLKTIFTRVERKDTIEAFEALGVAVTDLQGNVLPAIGLLQNFANVYDKLGGTVKKQAAELVGGVYQINILKALLGDLAKGSDSVATRAANTSTQAADEAIKRNEALNKSLAALLQQSQTTYQQIGAKVGDLGIAGAAKGALSGFNSSSFVRAFAEAGDSDTNSMGERAAAGFIKGFGNAVVFGLGPSLLIALGKITGSVFGKVQRDFADLVGANKISKDQAVIQEQIVGLYNAGDSALKRQLLTMGSLAERAAMVEGILARSANMQSMVSGGLGSLAGAVMGIRKVPRAAGGYDPFSAESAAIRAGVGGAHPSAQPVMIKNFAYGGGVTGPIVANTSEWMVKKGGGSAIYNPAMIQKLGLPPGATPIAAGGYIPNMAGGGTPYSSPDYYKNLGFGGSSSAFPFGVPPGSPAQSGNPVTGSAGGQGFGQFLKYAAAPASSGYDEAMKAKQAASLAAEQMAADFAKSQKELDKQHALEVKATELKQRQLDEMAKQLGNQKKYTGISTADLKTIERANEKMRKAEMDRYEAAGAEAIRAKQAMEAKFPSHNASPETMAAYISKRASGAGFADDYNDYLNRRMGVNRRIVAPTPASATIPAIAPRGFFGRMSDRFAANPLAGQLALSMGLPMIGGALPSFFSEEARKGGSSSGMGIGAVSSAFTGAGTGAAIGSFIPGIGTGIGTGIGAAIGAVSGAIGKMTKSFEELAGEIGEANAKIKMQFDIASEVARTQSQITDVMSSDQSPEEITKAVRRLRSQMGGNISKVSDPRVKSLLQSGNPEDLKKAMEMITEGGDTRGHGNEILSAVSGALGTSSTKGAFGYGEEAPERIAKAMAPFLAGKTSSEVANYSRMAQRDPLGAMRQIMLDAKIDEKQIDATLPGVGFFGGMENTRDLYRSGFAKAVSQVAGEKNQDPIMIARQKERAKRMSSLRAVSEAYRGQSEFAQIRSGSDLQIGGVEQQIALSSPMLLDTQKLRLQGLFGAQNIRSQFAGSRETQLLSGKSSLSDVLISKGGDSDAIRKMIDGLSSLSDVKGMIETLSSPQGILKMGVSGAATPEFMKALMDLQRTMEKLDESESEQIRVNNTTNQLLLKQLNFTKTYEGARAEYGGASRVAGANLMSSLKRFDIPDVIAKNIEATNLSSLNDEYSARATTVIPSGRRGFSIDPVGTYAQFANKRPPMSNGEYYGRRMGIGLNAEGAQRVNSAAAIRYLLNNPSAMGAKDLTGSQVTSGLMAEAEGTGLNGKSFKSMGDGFKAVFAGMKKDMADLSKLGANLGQSLTSSLSSAFGDFVTGAKSGKDAFRSFAVSVLNDASRMFASQAIQGILGSMFGNVSPSIGRANGGPIPGFAAGGKVPAMLTGGEYYIGPNAAKKIGYDTLHRINGYADGGMVRGGSGMKDDVPARLAPGSFIVKKSAVNKLGPDYLDSLINGKVQHRFFGGLLAGAVIGGGIGYLTGGKKGAIAGAIVGGISAGLAQNYAQTGNIFQADPNAGMFQFSSSVSNVPAGYEVGAGSAINAPVKAPMSWSAKLGLGLGAAALLGGASRLLTPKDPTFTPMTSAQISANRAALEREQSATSAPAGLFPWLSANQNGGQNLMGYVPPTRRLYANGGMVGGSSGTPLMFSEGGAVPGGSVDSASTAPMSSSRSGGAASVNVKIEINNNGTTSSSATSSNKDGQGGFGADFAQKLQKQVQGIVQQELVNQSRSDGFFAQKGRFIQR